MKQTKNLLVVSILVLVLSFVFVGCTAEKNLEKLLNNLNDPNANYSTRMEMNTPFGKMVVESKVDGNKTWTASFMGDGETFTEEVDGVTYEYKEVNGVWTKTISADEESSDVDVNNFSVDDFNYKKKVYTMKDECKSKYGFDKMSFTIDKDFKGMTMNITQISEGMELTGTMKIYNYGNSKIVLPKVN